MTFLFPLLRAALIAMVFMAGSVAAHEGHDHGDQKTTQPLAGSSPRA